MKAKKSYGQHFLNNESIAEKIANGLESTDLQSNVLEVGPGKGVLTKYLIEKYENLMVVEADRDMVKILDIHMPKLRGKIIQEDFLKLDLSHYFKDEPFSIIGNYPYNISSQILFKMLEYRNQVPELVGMFQKEVAERVVAGPGSKTYGVVSVLVQAYYDGEYLFSVEKGSFTPPPKVRSGVIRLTRKENQELGCDYKIFRSVVKQSFGQRRKMLRNTLKSLFANEEILKHPLYRSRPEDLSVQQFVDISKLVQSDREKHS